MIFKRLVLSDFGKFHQNEICLSPGLNIATGNNESGKTTLRRFVRSMLYGLERERGIRARKDEYTRLKPWEYGRFQGSMELEIEGKDYRLFRNFLSAEKEVRLTELATGRDIENPMEFLRQHGLKSETVYINTFWAGNACTTEDMLASELKDYLANMAYSGGTGLNLQKSLDWLAQQKKEILKQIPEQELASCMEQLMQKEILQEQMLRAGHKLETNLRRQKELEGAIKVKKGMSEQIAKERKQAEWEERQKFRGEWLLTLFGMLALLLAGVSFLLPVWQLRLAGLGAGIFSFGAGLLTGLPRMKRGRLAGAQKEELGNQLDKMTEQLEELYRELTRLLPETEQEKLRTEQAEERLQQLELLEEHYEALKQKKQSLLQEAEAVTLAADTLEQLSADLYEEFGARFATSLSEYAKAFTDHAYETLTADEELVLKAVTEEHSLEISDVSFGTGEQFYLALRFAAADVFDPDRKNPMILDDSFAAYDDRRLESAILTLAKCGRQVLLLSSTGREEAVAKQMGITYEAVF